MDETFHDLDLIAIITLGDLELDSIPANNFARIIVNNWKDALSVYGPGTIDLDIEHLAPPASDARRQFIALLTAVEESVRRFGEYVPASFLNRHCRVPGVVFVDYSTAILIAAIGKLQSLLTP